MPAPRGLAILVVALLLPALPSAEATHPPPRAATEAIATWQLSASAAVNASGVPSLDRGALDALREAGNRSVRVGSLHYAAAQMARYEAFATYASLSAAAPADNGTSDSRKAQRLWWLDRAAELHTNASNALAEARGDLKAFAPKTSAGLEWGILAGRILYGAHGSLGTDYNSARTKVAGFTNPEPDTSTTTYRAAVLGLVQTTAGASVLVRAGLDLLRTAKALDGTGPALNPEGRDAVLAAYLREATTPRTTGPEQTPFAFLARDAFNGGQPLFALGVFLVFDELRAAHTYEFRQQTGTINQSGLQVAKNQAAVDIEGTILAAPAGTGLLLLDAAAYARGGFDPISTIARLEAAKSMSSNLAGMRSAPGSPDEGGLGTATILGVAVVVLGIAAFLAFRRR